MSALSALRSFSKMSTKKVSFKKELSGKSVEIENEEEHPYEIDVSMPYAQNVTAEPARNGSVYAQNVTSEPVRNGSVYAQNVAPEGVRNGSVLDTSLPPVPGEQVTYIPAQDPLKHSQCKY